MTENDKIHRLRLQSGLSQKELAAKIKLKNQSILSKIESGQLKLKSKMKEDILNAFGITHEQFEKLEEKPYSVFIRNKMRMRA
jgi:ribosome-binding protein aMBF1 (putative translation factor)